ncbi:MAG: hypothetical protein ABI855_03530 [Bacteroidota bacterium]
MIDTSIIKFRNNQVLVNDYNENLKMRTDEILAADDFELYYDREVEFEEELTVEGFITALKPFFKKIDKQFIAYTRGFKLNHYYNQMQKSARKEKNDVIAYVEFCWTAEVSEYENVEEGIIESEFSYYATYHGVSFKEKDKYSFSFIPVNEWKHYPLKLNKKFQCEFRGHDENDDVVMKTLFESTREYTFHELIKTFVFELTWMGYTKDIKEKRVELDNQTKNIDKEDLIPFNFDEWMTELYEKQYDRAMKEERYEAAQRLKNKINKIQGRNKK